MARAFDPMQNVPSWKSAVARSQAYYMSMRGSTQFNVIHSYRGDVDPDDWLRAPLLVSYKIMNWAIKQINKKIMLEEDSYRLGKIMYQNY